MTVVRIVKFLTFIIVTLVTLLTVMTLVTFVTVVTADQEQGAYQQQAGSESPPHSDCGPGLGKQSEM